MGSTVLSLRIDGELLDRLRRRAARRGMSVQDYVVGTLVRDDFDERFMAAVEETERFYATGVTGVTVTGVTGRASGTGLASRPASGTGALAPASGRAAVAAHRPPEAPA
ncbi:hypothetical protein KQY30_20685 [Streptomyces sp. GMY02]|uniref:hypothetical protein n=1 Tax=Streptomyces sp. GMY02 TaxID=1333528 RepID=UPI001C2C9D04|nr:hypothetical protein [Streptomyces sp. GMY02]QXE39642.1 hypothetical protein KQY30_20685 [Streptomyces sp. GMY02]